VVNKGGFAKIRVQVIKGISAYYLRSTLKIKHLKMQNEFSELTNPQDKGMLENRSFFRFVYASNCCKI
jgi:hypothetical protein